MECTSSLQEWFWGKEKVSVPLKVCHFVSFFTEGDCWDQPCGSCHHCLTPFHFLQDMAWRHVPRKWQPWLQDIGLKSSTSAGSICREQRGGGEPGPSQAELKGAEWNQVEQFKMAMPHRIEPWSTVIWKTPGIKVQTIQLLGICLS